jgi:general secretion pathway protein K
VVAVLWILAALSTLISVYADYVINSATGFAVYDDRLRAEALVSAAIELTAYQQLTAPGQSRPTRGQFSFRLGKANVSVEFCSEAARIDLKAAPKQLLVGLFASLGARPEDAESFGDRVIAWRTAPPEGNHPEALAYRAARLPYGPRGAKFPHVGELFLVRGLPTAVVERAVPFLTVYSGRPQVNILDAPPEVIAALPGMTGERVKAVLLQRQTAPQNGQALLALLAGAQQFATTEGSRALGVTARIAFDNGRLASSEVVILVFEEGNEPFSVLSWRDDLGELRGHRRQLVELR